MNSEDINYTLKKQNDKAVRLRSVVVSSSRFKARAVYDFDRRREIKHKNIVDEINRQNLSRDYGV